MFRNTCKRPRWGAVFTLSLIMIVATMGTPAFAKTFGPLDIARIQSVSSVTISPDGKHAAYLVNVPRVPWEEDSGTSWRQLHVVDSQGNDKVYIGGSQRVGSIAWAPDGSSLYFLAKRGDDKNTDLYNIPIAGGEAVKALDHATAISSYAIHSDGTTLAFIAKPDTDSTTKKLEDKGFNPEIVEEEWKPSEIWIGSLAADAEAPQKLELEGSASSISWAKTGQRLVFTTAPTSLIDDSYMKKQIHVYDVESKKKIQSFKTEGKLGSFALNPAGTKVAMIAAEDIHDPSAGRLWVGDVASGKITDYLPGYMGHVQSIQWKNDKTIVYVGDEGVYTTVAAITSPGKPETWIPTGGKILANISFADAANAMAFDCEAPEHPKEVCWLDMGSSEVRKLTDHNPWIADMEMGKQEVVTYNARDGLEIQGILVRPLNEKKGQRYPLVMLVHGGPESHHRNGWMTAYSRPAQQLAAEGFATFFTNYRASTGRGVEFSKLNHKEPAGKEFDDLVDAVDHLIEIGLVDKDKVGVSGASYGGYATAWLSTYYSERFAAGVMFVGISNLISKVGTSDIPNELYQVHMLIYPWEDWDLYLRQSPLSYVEKARTPLLIVHGKDDPRVFRGQSMELYRFLKIIGQTPVRLIFYPGEGHGNSKSAARLDYNLRLMRWMRHFLKEGGTEVPPKEIEYPFDLETSSED